MRASTLIATLMLLLAASTGLAQPAAPVADGRARAAVVEGYAPLVDLALTAPAIVVGRVVYAHALSARLAPGLPAGTRRYLIRMDVETALVAPTALPARIEFLWDGVGRKQDLEKREVIAIVAPVVGRPAQYQLVSPRALLARTPATEARLRRIVGELAAPGARGGRVTGVARAFSVAGSVAGESETQIFLETAAGAPISVVVLRRPGEEPRFSAALGETIDEAAGPPARETLAWYWLACGLPATLPATATAELDADAAGAAARDYAFVRQALGPCSG